MGCLFSCFTSSNNFQEIECVNDIESVKENSDSDDYYDELNRPYFFNSIVYYRGGYYNTD